MHNPADNQIGDVSQTDLIPFSENDPNGAGLGVLSFPMVMGGLAGGIVIGLQVIGGGRKIVYCCLRPWRSACVQARWHHLPQR